MAEGKTAFSEEARFRILRLLDENPNLSQRDLARASGISVGTVNYVMQALLARGMVKIGRFAESSDKRRYAYLLTPRGASEKAALTRRFLDEKLEEYEALKREIEALKVEAAKARSAGDRHMGAAQQRED